MTFKKLTIRYELEGTELRVFDEASPEITHSIDLKAPKLEIIEKFTFHPQFWSGLLLAFVPLVLICVFSISDAINRWRAVIEFFSDMGIGGFILPGCLVWGLIKLIRHSRRVYFTVVRFSKKNRFAIYRNKHAVAEYEKFISKLKIAAEKVER